MVGKVIFISGIDTNVGKTVATGVYAKQLMDKGFSVVTQKMVQTGCQGLSEDIMVHRQIQGIPLMQEDKEGLTCPYVFPYPCSPHLAAKLVNENIQENVIESATQQLVQRYDIVLLEGAGGLMVPYQENRTTLDYLIQSRYPLWLVTSGKLGSINHTLLSLEICRLNHIHVEKLIYNAYIEEDLIIGMETRQYLQAFFLKHFPNGTYEELDYIERVKG
ncbi:dethiobiotin synthase [Pelistega ratti]|uniref:dethiobiotin synthase n=1 Tax=Pelistega ratti TaxID=2652177 RepID=UPI001356A09F|nr:dethiobiotin synthase [Pelistega ratti]